MLLPEHDITGKRHIDDLLPMLERVFKAINIKEYKIKAIIHRKIIF